MELKKDGHTLQELQYLQQHEKQKKSTSHPGQEERATETTSNSICPHCGAMVEEGMNFCEECGMPLRAKLCPHCHQTITLDSYLCPHCNKPTETHRCSFCGETMEEGERFCVSCGSPRDGIICPECQIVNYRSFCRRCNRPLNELAEESIKKVMTDPRVQHVRQLAEEMEYLEQQISELARQHDETTSKQDLPTLSPKDRQLLEKYRKLFGTTSIQPHQSPTPSRPAVVDKQKLRETIEAYKAKAAEMQKSLETLIPDSTDPPESQRNFLCACKVVALSTRKEKETRLMGWVCNLCGCTHKQPSDCAKPELGGRWIYDEIDIIKKIEQSSTIYL